MSKCPLHPETELVCYCPKCRGSAGGAAKAKKHSKKKLRAWGKLGGRPKKG